MNTAIRRAARLTGLTHSHISRVLHGRRNPRLDTARAIAKAMGIGVDRLCRIIDENVAKQTEAADGAS